MGYLKYTQYIYLAFAIYFIFDGVTKLNEGSDTFWLSFAIAVMAIFMFFFRRKFAKKFDDNKKK